MIQLVLCRTDVTDTTRFVARSTSSTEYLRIHRQQTVGASDILSRHAYLQNIQDGQVDKATLSGVIHLGPLDDYRMSGQVDSPCQSGCTAQNLGNDTSAFAAEWETTSRWTHLDAIRFKHPFHHVTIASQHSSMMDPEPILEQLFHLLVPRESDFAPEKVELWV